MAPESAIRRAVLVAVCIGMIQAEAALAQPEWRQQARLAGDVPAYGWQVAIDGDLAAVGAPGNSSRGIPDRVELWRRSGTRWAREATLAPLPGETRFWPLDLDGGTLVVGTEEQGVHVYVRTPTGWARARTLPPPGSPSAVQAIALSDRWLAAAYLDQTVAVHDRASWALDSILPGRAFRLALSGDTLVVGDREAEPIGLRYAGEVRIYARAAGVWASMTTLTAPAPNAGRQFGASVALDGDVLVVGSIGARADLHEPMGGTFVYRAGTRWGLEVQLAPSYPGQLGWDVAVDEGRVVVAAPTDGAGQVYMFEQVGSAWTDIANFSGDSPMAGLGLRVDVSGRYAIASVLSEDGGPGAAYIYALLHPDGDPCASPEDCHSGACVDGVCCNELCDNDCEACSVAAGAAADGVCSAADPDALCRPAEGACDVEERCDGLTRGCPADVRAEPTQVCRPSAGVCDAEERCSPSSPECPGDAPADCDDMDPCTVDSCTAPLGCAHERVAGCCVRNQDCDDGLDCTLDVCTESRCASVPLWACQTDASVDGSTVVTPSPGCGCRVASDASVPWGGLALSLLICFARSRRS